MNLNSILFENLFYNDLGLSRKVPFDKSNLILLAEVAEQLTAVIQRKRAETALKKVSHRNRLILQAAGEGIYGLDLEGNTIFVNVAAERMLGWKAADLIGMPHHERIHHTHSDGTPYPSTACPVHATLTNGNQYRSSDEKFWRKDGTGFPVEFASNPIYEGDEQVGAVITFVDITERLRQETYLRGQQRLATVGQLAAGIAHDFNNIMAVISLYTDLTLRKLGPLNESHKHLQIIREQANRAAELIRQILDFSRQTVLERSLTDLRPFLRELLKLLERTMPENIKLKMNYDKGDYWINADLTQLQQVLMNLVVNSRDAMPKGGTLQLNLTNYHLRKGDAPPLPDMPHGTWARIDITDTGNGIAPDHLNRVFEPFFTTKPVGKGTGLGLAQVYGIIKQHNGLITVTSQANNGTTFSIFLPQANTESMDTAEEKSMFLPHGNGETILVVEDEEAIRTAVCDILTTINYLPLPAENGEQALLVYSQQAAEIDLVISDMMMPGINGLELHDQLSAINPSLKMLLLSGYPVEENEIGQRKILEWLKKPVNMEQLAQALNRALILKGQLLKSD